MLPPRHLALLVACALLGAACSSSPSAPDNASPTARLSMPRCALAGDTVTADASASFDEDGVLVAYRYLFGDGTAEVQTTAPIARHRYDGPGVYEVVLTTTDARGAAARASTLLRVLPRATCTNDAACGEGSTCVGGLCQPPTDGGACGAAPEGCPTGSARCGDGEPACEAGFVCMDSCCRAVKGSG